MAFTESQKQTILFFLGIPGKTIIKESQIYRSQTADRLKNLNFEIETQALRIVDKLQNIDCLLDQAASRLSVSMIADIKTNPDEIKWLRMERKRLVNDLGSVLDLCSGSSIMIPVVC